MIVLVVCMALPLTRSRTGLFHQPLTWESGTFSIFLGFDKDLVLRVDGESRRFRLWVCLFPWTSSFVPHYLSLLVNSFLWRDFFLLIFHFLLERFQMDRKDLSTWHVHIFPNGRTRVPILGILRQANNKLDSLRMFLVGSTLARVALTCPVKTCTSGGSSSIPASLQLFVPVVLGSACLYCQDDRESPGEDSSSRYQSASSSFFSGGWE
jgi:hypothetical protein